MFLAVMAVMALAFFEHAAIKCHKYHQRNQPSTVAPHPIGAILKVHQGSTVNWQHALHSIPSLFGAETYKVK
jgi:hypothetical protein